MPKRRRLRAIPVSAGMDPEQHIMHTVEPADQPLACMSQRPAGATGMLKEAQPRTGPRSTG